VGNISKIYFAYIASPIMKGVIYMFNFFKKKAREEDPILKEINRQTEELKAITDSMRRDNESLEADIQIAEKILLNRGYSQEDLEKIKIKSKLKIVK
jgi:mevalonate kinase